MPGAKIGLPGRALVLLVLTLLVVLYACRDVTDIDLPQFANTANKQLVISGDGTGSGKASVPPTAGRTALICTITLGQAETSVCNKFYPNGTTVTLTAAPEPGHTFLRWSGACTGTGSCTLTMTQTRLVTATFAPPASQPSLTITGGGSGGGVVSSQPSAGGINCTIAAGQVSTNGCLALFPAQTAVTLTATPADGHTFAGWGDDCNAAGTATTCQLTESQARSVSATFNAPGIPAPEPSLGKWGAPFSTPVVAIHLNLLSAGKVLLWGHTGQPWLWDAMTYPSSPQAGFSELSTASELFCSGHDFLPDGKLLVAGGHDNVKGNGYGIPDVNIFTGGAWQSATAMHEGRWYPTATTLGDGQIVLTAGTDNNHINVKTPEVWNGTSWRQLSAAVFGLPYYPRMFLAPNGKLFYAGEGAVSKYLDVSGNGAWSNVASRIVSDRNYGSAVMLDAKVLYVGGGGASSTCSAPPTNRAEIIDLTSASPSWRAVGSMAYGRRQINLTILANGKVLATGGTSACGFNNEAGAVYAAEIWDPATEQWSTLGTMRIKRVYHSAAILLPDGRVLSAGGGDNGEGTSQFNAEVFSPPYLFKSDGTLAPRPTYTLSSTNLGYSQSVVVQTPDAARITKVTLVRLSSVTHAFNESQRLSTLGFTPAPDGQSLTATTPTSGNLAAPGPYMLFLIDDKGVPSIAQIVILQ